MRQGRIAVYLAAILHSIFSIDDEIFVEGSKDSSESDHFWPRILDNGNGNRGDDVIDRVCHGARRQGTVASNR